MLKTVLTILIALFTTSCQITHQKRAPKSTKKQYQLIPYQEKTFWSDYDALLKASAKAFYLKNSDRVFYLSYINYKKLSGKKSFQDIINSQKSKLKSTQTPSETPSQIAFWINTYNFFVISEIVNSYPIKSIKAIRYKEKKHLISGKFYSLNQIYKIALKYKDPRIIFALNSGAVSSPSIKLKSFNSQNLEIDLERQLQNNLLNPMIVDLENNVFNEAQLNLNEIFKAFNSEDFKDLKIEDFLKSKLQSDLKDFKRIKISKTTQLEINSKRETSKVLKNILENNSKFKSSPENY